MKAIIKKRSGIKWWEKPIVFVKRNILSIVAGICALFTWYYEKNQIEEHRSKITDFFRLENAAQIMETGMRSLELETNYTISNQKLWGNDSIGYRTAFFRNVANEVQQENQCMFTLEVQADIDTSLVDEIRNTDIARAKELQDKMNTKDFNTIYNFSNTHMEIFSNEVGRLQKKSQKALNELNKEMRDKFFIYQLFYLLAAALLTIDKIIKVRPKESTE